MSSKGLLILVFLTFFVTFSRGQELEPRAVVAILEEKRAEMMANDRAGHFIQYWQELTDQVRQMIARDYRYQAIKESRAARLG